MEFQRIIGLIIIKPQDKFFERYQIGHVLPFDKWLLLDGSLMMAKKLIKLASLAAGSCVNDINTNAPTSCVHEAQVYELRSYASLITSLRTGRAVVLNVYC